MLLDYNHNDSIGVNMKANEYINQIESGYLYNGRIRM